jgi:hypothetical protein
MPNDFILRSMADFTEYMKAAYGTLNKNATKYGVPSSAIEELTTPYLTFIAKEEVMTHPDLAARRSGLFSNVKYILCNGFSVPSGTNFNNPQ